jgi:RHS repeat-associated protein
MQKLIFSVICLMGFVGVALGQASVSGPSCVVQGSSASYTLFSAASSFSYSVSNGTLSTGGTSGSYSGGTNTTITVTWSSSASSGSILLNSSDGNASETVTLTTTLISGNITGAGQQTINYNTIPATITCAAASGEACPANYAYQWMQSTDDVNFSNISGATGQNLTFSTAYTQTTYFKRQVTETHSNTTAYSNVEPVYVLAQLVTGTISPASQTINYNTVPSALSVSGTSGGNGAYSYQWQSCPTSSGTYTTISGATSSSYTPPALTAATYYEVVQTSNGVSVTSAPAVVNVYPALNAGSVSPASQTINYNTNASQLTLSGVSGGNGTYSYQWQSSPNNSTWTNVSGATATAYTPTSLTSTTYYRVAVTSNGATVYTSGVVVTVYAQLHAGAVGSSQTINYNTVPAQLSLTGVSGGNSSYTYQWYYSTNGGSTWTAIGGATGTTYAPAALTITTEYEVVVASNGVQATSGAATITVNGQLISGTISPSSQTINYNTASSAMSISGTSGGTGTYTYQWQSCATSNGTYSTISGATSSSYTTPALMATTYYEVVQTSGGLSVTSAPAVVNVYPALNAGSVAPASQTINYNTNASQLTLSGVSGGSGTYSYQWQSSPNNSTWTNVSGVTATTYTPTSLTSTTYYRVAVTSNGLTVYTSGIVVTVYAQLHAGAVGSSQSINYNTVPAQLSLTGVSGGNSSYTYLWYYSANGGSTWTAIGGATGTTYAPGALTTTTEYEVVVTSNGVQATSAVATITVYGKLVSGTISPASQSIGYNTAPAAMSISGGSGGSGTNTYQWQSCTTINGAYSAIGATGSSYSPPALTATIYYEVVTTSNGISVTSSPASVIVNPPLAAGSVNPALITIGSGTSPGLLTCTAATGGACSGNYTYQWYSSPDNATWTAISGATGLSYSPGNLSTTTYYMCKVSCNGATANSSSGQVVITGAVGSNLNYIRTRTLSKPGVMDTVTADGLTSPIDVLQSTTYFDGLGRPIQTVAKQASPLQNDMVEMQVYDPIGREAYHYLPYTSPSNNGNYKTDPYSEQSSFNTSMYSGEQYFYGQSAFEPSPLNRVQTEYPAGSSWVGNGRGVGKIYSVNAGSDSVQNWTIASAPGSLPLDLGPYPTGALNKTVTINEQGNQVVEYKDLQDRLILKKVQVVAAPGSAHVGWQNTYFVFDTLGHLRFVVQPQAVALIDGSWSISQSLANELCFRYEYDYRGRMSIKKMPGVGEEWMVYDARDRQVMLADSDMRVQGQWLVTEYDLLNRPDSTGLMTDSHSQSYWQNLANNSLAYPNISGFVYQLRTVNHYDSYTWVPSGVSATMTTTYTTSGTYFITGYNTSPTYSVPITYFPVTRGELTGTTAYIIPQTTGQYMTNVNFYDDRGRVIQTENVNISNGSDITSTQFDFIGKPLRELLVHTKNGLPAAQTHKVLTKLAYDQLFRIKSIYKNIDGAAVDQLIDSVHYDELGRAQTKYLGNNVDNLNYTYNVRNWLTAINPNYVNGSAANYFGMELGYDKTSSVAPGNTYKNPQFEGNIEGTVWKTAGSGVNRKYDFSYDPINRLIGADFNQYNGSGFDKSAKIDFSVSGLTYDLNGNILSMTQQGFVLGGSQPIDGLTYSYMNGGVSNRLAGITDANNNATSQLGDFHYNPATKQATDYAYDGNGNLHSDNNKNIDSIGYNYLNLVQYVHMKGKGTIAYTYDALGTKWRKTITDSVAGLSTTITYIGRFVYQQVDAISNPNGGYDTLQFMGHEEGRTRWALHTYINGTSAYGFEYDFFEKDHLDNTRMVLTQEKDTTNYIATMEYAYRGTELKLFGNIANTSVAWTSMPNYQNIPNNIRFAYTSPNDSVSKVDYTGTTGQTTGPSLLLKVMANDTVYPGVQCYYVNTSASSTNSSFNSVLNSLAGGLLGTPAGAAEGTLSGFTSSTGPVYSAVNSFLGTYDPAAPAGYPKAYLNWILLDDQFNYVSSSSGSVATASATYPAGSMNTVAPGGPIVIPKNGYFYVWVSNETQGWDVYFDNMGVQYKRGPVLEENHYYPFGLTMAGISDKALKTPYVENKYRFNGKELQNKEFSDGTGLEDYDFSSRFYDPQTGRFYQVDPMAVNYYDWSLYEYVRDNPILRLDPTGKWDITVHVYNDRAKYGYGVAILTDRHGKEIFRWKVRAEGVAGRNRKIKDNDTPLGVYDIPDHGMWITGPSPKVKDWRLAYGPNYRLLLNAESGEIVESKRDLIRMHGGRQEEKNDETGEYTSLENPTLEKTHGCLRAFDADMAKVKQLTDDLMDNDDEEVGGKLTVQDDLVEHDDGQYLPPGEGIDFGWDGGIPSITFLDPRTHKFHKMKIFEYWDWLKQMKAAWEKTNASKNNNPAPQPTPSTQ